MKIYKGDLTELRVGEWTLSDPPYTFVTVDKAPEQFTGTVVIDDPGYQGGARTFAARVAERREAEAAKSDGQVAQETLHRAGLAAPAWNSLKPARQAAWEAVAKAVIDRHNTKALAAMYDDRKFELRPAQKAVLDRHNTKALNGMYGHGFTVPRGAYSPTGRLGFEGFGRPIGEPPAAWLEARKKYGEFVQKRIDYAKRLNANAGVVTIDDPRFYLKDESTKMDDKNDTIKALNNEIERLLAGNAAVLEDVSDLRINFDEERARAERLEAKCTALEAELESCRRAGETALQNWTVVRSEVARVTGERNEAQRNLAVTRADYRRLSDEAKDQSDRLLRERNDARQEREKALCRAAEAEAQLARLSSLVGELAAGLCSRFQIAAIDTELGHGTRDKPHRRTIRVVDRGELTSLRVDVVFEEPAFKSIDLKVSL